MMTYAELAVREREVREELAATKKLLAETREVLEHIEPWWRDSSSANFVLTSRLKNADVDMMKLLEEERRQKLIWKEAYESVIHSRTWRMISKVKRVFGRK